MRMDAFRTKWMALPDAVRSTAEIELTPITMIYGTYNYS